MVLYLRVVHSVDYYNHCEYPNEDEMPNRCGIMHVRGSPPTAKVTSTELQEYCRNFETKMAAFLQPVATLSTDEFDKLGAKNADAYPFFIFCYKKIISFVTAECSQTTQSVTFDVLSYYIKIIDFLYKLCEINLCYIFLGHISNILL